MAVLVGKEAPDFTAKAVKAGEVIDDFTLSQFKGNKYVVLFLGLLFLLLIFFLCF